jgi:uncharacterized membrane protein
MGSTRHVTRLRWAALSLGFGLGGFFDGILLHQVLQWHHLLSGLESARGDLPFLILTDGLFHVLMYVVTGIGLWLLWRGRGDLAAPDADRRFLRDAVLGFAAWHIIDSVVSHWLIGLHRIRMDVPNPLVWDLVWFVVFGLGPLALGWFIHRGGGTGGSRRAVHMATLMVVAVLAAGTVAALPTSQQNTVMVLFGPGVTSAEAFAALGEVDARVAWIDPSERLWAVHLGDDASAAAFYRHGALLVSRSPIIAGCLRWVSA